MQQLEMNQPFNHLDVREFGSKNIDVHVYLPILTQKKHKRKAEKTPNPNVRRIYKPCGVNCNSNVFHETHLGMCRSLLKVTLC